MQALLQTRCVRWIVKRRTEENAGDADGEWEPETEGEPKLQVIKVHGQYVRRPVLFDQRAEEAGVGPAHIPERVCGIGKRRRKLYDGNPWSGGRIGAQAGLSLQQARR